MSRRERIQKLLWRSRRGMLELDRLFQNYLANYGTCLTDQQLDEFERLLEIQDQELFDAFLGARPLDKNLEGIFAQIVSGV